MRKRVVVGALIVVGAAALGGCVSTPSLEGSYGAPSFSALQAQCDSTPTDYGADAQSVFSAFYDAYVAERRGGLSREQFCAFQRGIAERHRAFIANPGAEARSAWATFILGERARALSWRAAVDPTLRAG
ncbi:MULTISPECIES: hypothetical protein [unclassified Caballeronia]|uniref:hypothetical protein n=1 Tax=unclassified Caballeronia TaxID=2646786 RepID=UPI00286474CF|nr:MULTISPECIES: hypothetical protein [unclassified Caballeronia]MDR5736626.1 hypothetical protein [Caballeronia sp. LZ016]MDR5810894.1 hypothetical protein [Caballeronia sp. LZ019]